MAGKYHKDFQKYRDGGGQIANLKRKRCYAEGYQANRALAARASNPHAGTTDQESDFWAWDQGWRDGNTPFDPTHVGGPISAGGIVPG